MTPILEIRNLAISFDTEEGEIPAVNDVSLKVFPGKTLEILFGNKDLLKVDLAAL